MSQDREPRQLENWPLLREKEVRIQEEMNCLQTHVSLCITTLCNCPSHDIVLYVQWHTKTKSFPNELCYCMFWSKAHTCNHKFSLHGVVLFCFQRIPYSGKFSHFLRVSTARKNKAKPFFKLILKNFLLYSIDVCEEFLWSYRVVTIIMWEMQTTARIITDYAQPQWMQWLSPALLASTILCCTIYRALSAISMSDVIPP